MIRRLAGGLESVLATNHTKLGHNWSDWLMIGPQMHIQNGH